MRVLSKEIPAGTRIIIRKIEPDEVDIRNGADMSVFSNMGGFKEQGTSIQLDNPVRWYTGEYSDRYTFGGYLEIEMPNDPDGNFLL